jgi:fluoride exporter
MITAALVGVFGVAGALLRFAVDSWFAHRTVHPTVHRPGARPHWPWATLTVNIIGSFLIGVSLGLTDRLGLGPEWHMALTAGLAGGLTTFSSWTTATVRLASGARYRAAAFNVAVNLLAGFAAAALGRAL